MKILGVVPCTFLALAGLAACGSSQKTANGSAATASANLDWGGGNMDRSRCKESGKQVVTADTDRDQKPDVWKLYSSGQQGGQEVQVLTCKQVDLNHDGKIDLVDHYGDDGQIAMTELDFDFDGKFDQTNFFNGGKVVRKERDMDFDHRPDHVEYYEGAKLARVERDGNNDGRVDEWHYYEDGRLDRIGYDTKGGGKADRWDRAPDEDQAAAASPAGEASPAPAGPGAPAPATAPPATAPPPAQ